MFKGDWIDTHLDIVLYSTVLHSTVMYFTVQYCTSHNSTVDRYLLYISLGRGSWFVTIQYPPVLYGTQYNSIVYCTACVLYCTVLDCTPLYCIAQNRNWPHYWITIYWVNTQYTQFCSSAQYGAVLCSTAQYCTVQHHAYNCQTPTQSNLTQLKPNLGWLTFPR